MSDPKPPTGAERHARRTSPERPPVLDERTRAGLIALDAKVRSGTYVPSTIAAARRRLQVIRARRQDSS